jgi:cytochrome c oxidase subunit 5b
MWRRLFTSPHLKTLSPLSHSHPRSAAVAGLRSLDLTRHVATQSGIISFIPLFLNCIVLISIHFYFVVIVAGSIKKRVEDVVPIATGHEREEIQADLEVFSRL